MQLIKREAYTEEQTRAVVSDFYRHYTVIELDQPILLTASALREQYRLSYWDGFIVACALTGGVSTLYIRRYASWTQHPWATHYCQPF